MKTTASRLATCVVSLCIAGTSPLLAGCAAERSTGTDSSYPYMSFTMSERAGATEGADTVNDQRHLSDGTAYEWDGDLINYPAEWEKFFSSLPSRKAIDVLNGLTVAQLDSSAGYTREKFGERWVDVDGNGCNTRNDILGRDLTKITYTSNKYRCIVKTGELDDPYSGKPIHFERAQADAVQIDHIVALYNAWRTGAQKISEIDRIALANDPYNLIAVDGPTNYEKSDADASRWLPSNDSFRCEYIARQIGVKARYNLWVTPKEKKALTALLEGECQGVELPDYDAIS